MTREDAEHLHVALRYLTDATRADWLDTTHRNLLVARQHAVYCGATPTMITAAMRQAYADTSLHSSSHEYTDELRHDSDPRMVQAAAPASCSRPAQRRAPGR